MKQSWESRVVLEHLDAILLPAVAFDFHVPRSKVIFDKAKLGSLDSNTDVSIPLN